MSDSGSYIHGTHPDEQDRLGLMNRLINEGCLRHLGPAGELRVLDVGSGLGQFTRLLARSLPDDATVVGVEADADQLAAAAALAAAEGEAGRVEFRLGRAEALPLAASEWGTFDLAHARFLLEHHTAPQRVVDQMARAVRPGGRVALLDDDHDVLRLWPEAPLATALWTTYARGYESLGCDPFVGRRLGTLACAAGLRPARAGQVSYTACHGQPEFPDILDNLARVMSSGAPTLVEHGLATRDGIAAAVAELREWGCRPDATVWYSIDFLEARRPC